MAAWITLAATDLDDYLVAAQTAALRSAALGGGQTDPFGRVMPDTASFIRQKIRSGGFQVSATANAIPPELKWAGAYLVIEALQVRIPALKLTEDQKTQVKEARRQLDRLADGKEQPTIPDDPELPPDTQSGFSPSVTPKTLNFSRDQQDGI